MTTAPISAGTAPLSGMRVLVTRARAQAHAFSSGLRDLGADVFELPTIEIVPAPTAPIDDALRRIHAYDWIVFTSVNGVAAFCDRADAVGVDLTSAQCPEIAAIGNATAGTARSRGLQVAFIPERFVAESVVDGMTERGIARKRVLLPRADIARDTLPDGLRAAGAEVDIVVAYRTQRPPDIEDHVLTRLLDGQIDVVTFASPSTVRNLSAMLGDCRPPVRVACIGPVTSDAARECGFVVDIEADEYSVPGLTRAVVALAERLRMEREMEA